MVQMGFSESAAREALHRSGGNLERAIDSLLSCQQDSNNNTMSRGNISSTQNGSLQSGTNFIDNHNNVMVHSEVSQFTFPNGRSACTCIALSSATLGLKKLSENSSNPDFCGDVINAELIQDAIIAGVGMYENRPITALGIEHMSVEEVLHSLPLYSAELQLIGDVRQGIVSTNRNQNDMGIRSILTSCREDGNANKSKWMSIVMTKTPETVAIFLPPIDAKDFNSWSFKNFVLIDSHSRPQFSTVPGGSYAMIFENMDDLVRILDKLFPVTDLGSDVGEVMSMMYNSFDVYAFQLKT